MKLIALVIKQYDELFKNQIFNFSDEYKVDFNFETNELKIDKNPDYIEKFYGESIYNISPIVGINGVGKSTILNLIGYYHRAEDQNKDINQFFYVYLDTNGKFYLRGKNYDLNSITIEGLATDQVDINGYCDYQKRDKLIYIMNEDRRPFGSFGNYPFLEVRLIQDFGWYILNGIFEAYEVLYSRGLVSSSYKFSFGLSIPEKFLNVLEEKEFFFCLVLMVIVKIRKKFELGLSDEEIERHFVDGDYQTLFDKITEETEEKKDFINSLVNFLNYLEQFIHEYKIKEYSDTIRNRIVEIGYGRENFDNRFKFEKLYLDNENLLNKASDLKYDDFRVIDDFYYNMSTGETNILKVMSYVKWLQMNPSQETCQLVVDELESGMHLEWSRSLINFLVNYINEINKVGGMNFQLIFTTHSPYMLSDIKPGNVIMLEKNQETGYSEGKVLQNTFAKNIQEIMKENLIDNIYGDFALAKINSMISRLNGEEGDEEELLKEIHLISEPILRNKLLEMYDKKYNTSEFSIEKQLLKLGLTDEQRQKVRTMIEENTRNT
ncbi:ATP-binding protein [Streptococcus mitis]|uniref:ATP-binding protein n=1 Tax=Streptococcus mitis TaxID=28037 RepID=UPI0021B68B92|nr:ATP-binding protein [Streptococcus mitis]